MIKACFKIVFALFVLLLIVVAYLSYGLLLPLGMPQPKLVQLHSGSSTRHIANELKDAAVIRSVPAFLLLHYWRVQPLKAGEYLFDRRANALEVYDRLARGDIYVHTLVIPEGYNLWDIATAMDTAGLATRNEFLQIAIKDAGVIADLDPTAKSLEGYLFPDTYAFTRTQSLPEMVTVMVRRFRQNARSLGLVSDFHRVVTMASIVEKETAAPEERPLVASVYYNRLTRRMAFGADPTVVYAALLAGRYTGVIHESDLQSDSPYNTYKYRGLPPGPIANPGRASLAAAMHPALTDYLYFVSDNNGHHRFARTAEEHDRNVMAYRRAAGTVR